jgi:hypothetical protein
MREASRNRADPAELNVAVVCNKQLAMSGSRLALPNRPFRSKEAQA